MADIKINPIYNHILQTDARVVILYGGRDTGKSYFVGDQFIPLQMMQSDYFRGVCVRKTYASLKDSCFQEVIDGIEEMGMSEYFKVNKSPQEINYRKSRLLFRGLDNSTKIKSLKGISFIWVEEAEDITKREFDELLMLLRAGVNPKIIMTFNPVNEDQFTNAMFTEIIPDEVLETFGDGDKKVWIKNITRTIEGKEVTIKCLCLRTTYEDNYYIDAYRKAAIEQVIENDPYLEDVYRKGKYGTRGGRILTNIEEKDLSDQNFINYDNKGYSQDFGFNHANAILAVAEKDNCLYVFHELYGYEKDTAEWITEANKQSLHKNLTMICDCAEPDRIKTWNKAGYRARGVKKFAGSVGVQIDRLKKYDKIYINTTCTNTLKEAKQYMWKQNKQGQFTDEPVTVFDDAMAALRYATDLFHNNNTWGFGNY